LWFEANVRQIADCPREGLGISGNSLYNTVSDFFGVGNAISLISLISSILLRRATFSTIRHFHVLPRKAFSSPCPRLRSRFLDGSHFSGMGVSCEGVTSNPSTSSSRAAVLPLLEMASLRDTAKQVSSGHVIWPSLRSNRILWPPGRNPRIFKALSANNTGGIG
jgi:hypothetical protein